jgi:hypothetical protein
MQRKLDFGRAAGRRSATGGRLRAGAAASDDRNVLDAPQISHAEAVWLMERALDSCPYSRATRGNIDVTLSVNGATIEREAA